jgi:hypothetical protein
LWERSVIHPSVHYLFLQRALQIIFSFLNAEFNTVAAALKCEFVFWFVFPYIRTSHSLTYRIETPTFTFLLRKSHEFIFPLTRSVYFFRRSSAITLYCQHSEYIFSVFCTKSKQQKMETVYKIPTNEVFGATRIFFVD